MAWTVADLTNIEEAISSGELMVQYEDKQVRYRSMDELFIARATIQNSLSTTTTIVPRQIRLQTSKGNTRT